MNFGRFSLEPHMDFNQDICNMASPPITTNSGHQNDPGDLLDRYEVRTLLLSQAASGLIMNPRAIKHIAFDQECSSFCSSHDTGISLSKIVLEGLLYHFHPMS